MKTKLSLVQASCLDLKQFPIWARRDATHNCLSSELRCSVMKIHVHDQASSEQVAFLLPDTTVIFTKRSKTAGRHIPVCDA